MTLQTLDPVKLDAFVGRTLVDWGALASAPLILIGQDLGLYDALAAGGPLTARELAVRTGTVERYIQDWLVNQAAGGIVDYDPATGRYALPVEHGVALSAMTAGYDLFLAAIQARQEVASSFKHGGGVRWGEHHADVWSAIERHFRATYEQFLVPEWIPALGDFATRLETGARVADVGCGYGSSTIIMANAYPNSSFSGFDNHAPSIDAASAAAAAAGVAERAQFQTASATNYPIPAGGYDLIAFFDSLHDMANPVEVTRYARTALAPGGKVLVVEPMAGERVEDNLHPLGRVNSASSVLLCATNALADGDTALGTLASDTQLRETFQAAGFTHFRRIAEPPFNRVFEVTL